MESSFLLYGANGYTGELIAREAAAQGMKPILAGRSEEKIRPLAEELGLEFRVFGLEKPEAIDAGLRGVGLALHAAGPFFRTARPMMEGCLRNRIHYLDITGEIAVFEMAAALDARAREAGIMLMPGAGFDVAPTDCLALYLKEQLPDATHLQLAFTTLGSRLSQGTATTMAENLGEGGAVRKDGKIRKVPLGHKTMMAPFTDEKSLFVMAIPWGDVSTAFYSTGIPNIETYTSVHPRTYRYVKWQRYFNWLLRTPFVRNFAKRRIRRGPAGPTASQREKANSYIWGRVSNDKGESRTARLRTPEGYTLTALSSLIIARKALQGNAPAGFQTPARAYGKDLVMEIPLVTRSS